MGQRKSALRRGWIAGMIVLTIGMTGGCAMGRKAEQETLRMSGIEKLEAGDYTGAIADLEAALNLGKGRVSAVELDILKYRAEAEYKAGDYGAAAHTYEVLRQVEGEKPEYARLHCLLSIQAGNVEQALADYQEIYKEYLSTEAGKADEAVKEEMMDSLRIWARLWRMRDRPILRWNSTHRQKPMVWQIPLSIIKKDFAI